MTGKEQERLRSLMNKFTLHNIKNRVDAYLDLMTTYFSGGSYSHLEHFGFALSRQLNHAATSVRAFDEYFRRSGDVPLSEVVAVFRANGVTIGVSERAAAVAMTPFQAVLLHMALVNVVDNAVAAADRALTGRAAITEDLRVRLLGELSEAEGGGTLTLRTENPGELPEEFGCGERLLQPRIGSGMQLIEAAVELLGGPRVQWTEELDDGGRRVVTTLRLPIVANRGALRFAPTGA